MLTKRPDRLKTVVESKSELVVYPKRGKAPTDRSPNRFLFIKS